MSAVEEDPYAGLEDELTTLAAAIEDYTSSLEADVKAARIDAGIKTGSPNPLTNSPQWIAARSRLEAALSAVEHSLVETGLEQGIALLPSAAAPALSARVGELASEFGRQLAVDLAEGIDAVTRAGIRQSIGRAAQEYVGNQSLKTLRRLREEIRSVIGLTPKQAARVEAWRAGASASSLTPEQVSAGVAERAAAGKALRAQAIADRGLIESVSFGRHQSWLEAKKTGSIPPTAKKVWRTQGDGRVRPLHRAQAAVGPIPLEALFQIMKVQHPPSLDYG